jgi:hypothetical protein
MDAATTSGAFAGSTLADKLHKLNASQQSIESIHSSFFQGLYYLLLFLFFPSGLRSGTTF